MKKWVFISDLIFTFLALFLPALCLLRYYRWTMGLSLLVAALIGGFGVSLVALFKGKKDARLLLRREEERERQQLLYHLALLPSEKCLTLLCDGKNPKEEGGVYYIDGEELTFAYFSWTSAGINELLPFIKLCLEKGKKGTLYCHEISAETSGLLSQFSIECVQGTETYQQLKEEDRLPKVYLSEPYFTKKKTRLPRVWFAKKNSRRFLVCGGLLLLSSLFVPFPYYYVAFGSAMVVAAALIRMLGYR